MATLTEMRALEARLAPVAERAANVAYAWEGLLLCYDRQAGTQRRRTGQVAPALAAGIERLLPTTQAAWARYDRLKAAREALEGAITIAEDAALGRAFAALRRAEAAGEVAEA